MQRAQIASVVGAFDLPEVGEPVNSPPFGEEKLALFHGRWRGSVDPISPNSRTERRPSYAADPVEAADRCSFQPALGRCRRQQAGASSPP